MASSGQTAWDDGEVLFLGTGGAGIWQYDVGNGLEAISDGSGADFPLNGGDIYKVSLDITTNSTSDIEIFVENESSGTTSNVEQVSIPGGVGDLESIGFANGVVASFQNLIFDDLSITQGPTTPIPVELAAFDALADGRSAVLTWSTLSETNNDRFVVEHAAPGAGFSPAGSVEGNGTTTQRSTYRFTVADLEPGTHRFRLRQYDIDGASELSEALSLNIGVDGLAVSGAAPHPVQGESAVNISVDSASPVRVELFNLLGQRVRTLFDGTVTPGRAERVAIRGADLPSGTYFVRTTADAGSDVQRITIVR
ncbi:T9SS type A sorting domain-containing protein [Longibacter sp.]|uniref:T9SS type A sorting domain-containing protein n=1 Tax=Longibacter sp. TaxID=2045415 RepID=UPI003EB6D7A7